MKQLLVILAIGFLVPTASAQKVAFTNKIKIEDAQVGTIQKDGKTVRSIDFSSLKDGQNYLRLESGNTLYFEMKAGKIKTVTLANSAGMQSGKITIGSDETQTVCSGKICACWGAGCNNMKKLCAAGMTCAPLGYICICGG